jgi:hypothetical protein
MIAVNPSGFGRLIADMRRKPAGCKEHQYLVHIVARDVEVACRSALAHSVCSGQTNRPVKFHGINLQTFHTVARIAK